MAAEFSHEAKSWKETNQFVTVFYILFVICITFGRLF